MAAPISMMYAGIFGLFALILSARAGLFRSKSGISILFGVPANMELAERVRVHQNFLEYVPLMLILMAAIELNGGSSMLLYVVGDLLIIARFSHAIGLRHDNIRHVGRAIGAGGTALVMFATVIYALWLAVPGVIDNLTGT
jgi:uncharacterized membrane protein YecN with MAPEG domain